MMGPRRTIHRTTKALRRPAIGKVLRRGVIPLVALTVITLTTIAVLLWRTNQRDHDIAVARQDAPQAARTTVTAMLSYSPDTVDKDLADVPGLTGTFRDDFRDLVTKKIAPVAKEKGVTTKARVAASGVLAASPDQVTVLMFVDQVTVSTAIPNPTTSSSRVTVTVDKRGGQWLVSGMNPL